MNEDKTEKTLLKRDEKEKEEWRETKKLGSLLGDQHDIKRRKSLSQVALTNMNKIWFSKKYVSLSRKLQLYNTLVKSVLLYNCSTWGLTIQDENQLNSFYRKQLRNVIGVRWPHRISCHKLYQRTNTQPN